MEQGERRTLGNGTKKKCLAVSLSQSMRSRVDGKHEEMVAIDLLAFVFCFSHFRPHDDTPENTFS